MLYRPARLAIVDDHTLFRKALKNFLSEQKDLDVAIEASNISDLLSKLKATPVDIVIMGLYVTEVPESQVLTAIRTECPGTKLLVMSSIADNSFVNDLLDAGIHGIISKSEDPEDLLQAIVAVSQDRIYRNRVLTDALYWNKQNNTTAFAGGSVFIPNEREKKILRLIWDEKSNKEIADELFLGVRSVEKIRQDLKEKVGVKSTVGLLKYAINKGIIGVTSGAWT